MRNPFLAALACLVPTLPSLASAAAPGDLPTTADVITAASSCTYLNLRTASPSPNWPDLGYGGRWTTGRQPFGHEDVASTDVGTPARVVYFRCPFTLPADRRIEAAVVSLRADDGAVALVNGQEIGRFNVGSGPRTRLTYATQVDNNDGKRWQTMKVAATVLRPGENILGVQVHAAGNPGWMSTDLTMEAKATVTLAGRTTAGTPAAPPIPPSPPTPPTATPQPPGRPGWRLLWSDEFNGVALNQNRWRAYANTYGDTDRYMLHCLTPANVTVSNGTLRLKAERRPITCPNGVRRDYASGFVGSRESGSFYPLFGRFEIRARAPHGQGLFPAIWLRHAKGASTAEVDIFEQFHSSKPGQATQTLHFPRSIGYNVAKKGTAFEQAVRGRGGWHTFSVDITPLRPGDRTMGRFRFAIDGKTSLEYDNTRMSSWSGTEPAWDIALQLYVGGSWAGLPDQQLGFYPARGGICAQTSRAPAGGNPANCPAKGIWLAPWNDSVFEIDYVRVYVPG